MVFSTSKLEAFMTLKDYKPNFKKQPHISPDQPNQIRAWTSQQTTPN